MRGAGALGAPALKLAGDGAVSVAGLASSARGAAALEGLRERSRWSVRVPGRGGTGSAARLREHSCVWTVELRQVGCMSMGVNRDVSCREKIS